MASDVGGTHGGRTDERRLAPKAHEPRDHENPPADQADVKARDREQMDQPRLGEPVLELGVNRAAPAQHERVHQRRPRAIELGARGGENGAKLRGKRGRPRCRIDAAHHERSARPPCRAHARYPDGVHPVVESRRRGRARRPPGAHLPAAARAERLDLGPAAEPAHRLDQPNGEPKIAGR